MSQERKARTLDLEMDETEDETDTRRARRLKMLKDKFLNDISETHPDIMDRFPNTRDKAKQNEIIEQVFKKDRERRNSK